MRKNQRIGLGYVSKTTQYYPTELERASNINSGGKHYFDLKTSLCTSPLIDRVSGNLPGNKYEQLYIMLEMWDLGVQKGDALLSMREDGKPLVMYNEGAGNWS